MKKEYGEDFLTWLFIIGYFLNRHNILFFVSFSAQYNSRNWDGGVNVVVHTSSPPTQEEGFASRVPLRLMRRGKKLFSAPRSPVS